MIKSVGVYYEVFGGGVQMCQRCDIGYLVGTVRWVREGWYCLVAGDPRDTVGWGPRLLHAGTPYGTEGTVAAVPLYPLFPTIVPYPLTVPKIKRHSSRLLARRGCTHPIRCTDLPYRLPHPPNLQHCSHPTHYTVQTIPIAPHLEYLNVSIGNLAGPGAWPEPALIGRKAKHVWHSGGLVN